MLLARVALVASILAPSILACGGQDVGGGGLRRGGSTADGEEAATSEADEAPTPEAPAPTPEPPPTYLSDLAWAIAENGHGPAEKDRSNGEVAEGDGAVLSIGNTTYDKGLGVHSLSQITFELDGAYRRFVSDVGVDDEVPEGQGTIAFQVFVDDGLAWESGVMRRDGTTKTVNVPVDGARRLRLVVTDGGDGAAYDHGDWAGARLLR